MKTRREIKDNKIQRRSNGIGVTMCVVGVEIKFKMDIRGRKTATIKTWKTNKLEKE